MDREHLYIVAYDIGDASRWRRVFKIMKGYGQWLQLSVFQCRLGARRHAELVQLLDGTIKAEHDHVVLIDLGPAEGVEPKFVSLGKTFDLMERGPMVV
jgi:CRISPR-associated protein Cas2